VQVVNDNKDLKHVIKTQLPTITLHSKTSA